MVNFSTPDLHSVHLIIRSLFWEFVGFMTGKKRDRCNPCVKTRNNCDSCTYTWVGVSAFHASMCSLYWHSTNLFAEFSHKRWWWLLVNLALLRGIKPKVMLSSVVNKSHAHITIAQRVVFKIIFQDLLHWTEMFVRLLVTSREFLECESK